MIWPWATQSNKPEFEGFVLVLGGGGGRGLAHLGVLDVLQQYNLKPDVIVGSSIGALVGAMYALQPDAKACIRQVRSFLESDTFEKVQLPVMRQDEDDGWYAKLSELARQSILFAKAVQGISVVDTQILHRIVDFFCEDKDFCDTAIPMYITAVHFPAGHCRLFSSSGDVSLAQAVAASMAIPSVFEPVDIQGERFVDGGVVAELPTHEARMLANKQQLIVAVNVGSEQQKDYQPQNMIEMLDWAAHIKSLQLRKFDRELADILIEPNVALTQWHDFSNPEEEIEKGRQVARDALPEILQKLGREHA